MIDPKRSKFKKTTRNYKNDSVFEIIDVEEAIKKNKAIDRCPEEDFIYHNNSASKSVKDLRFSDYDFELDNGGSQRFTDYFEVKEVLGEGSFGLVIAAFDLKHRKELVAIKIIEKNRFRNLAEFIKNEVEIQAGIDHKNIVKLYYIRENSNYIFLVMELMKGGSLRHLITERYSSGQYFKDEECSLIIKNILEGLSYLHSLKIIHRDIKPENIMLKDKNDLASIKIGDFGFSTVLNDDQYRLDCGTVIYMSPEVHGASEASDIWACGFILYILASGGLHPLYKSGMSREEYIDLLVNTKEWKFPETFPILARNFFLKLCKTDKHRRYEMHKALKHPWITRSTKGEIPMTLMDSFAQRELIFEFKSLLRSGLFLYSYKTLFKSELEVKKEKSEETKSNLHPKEKDLCLTPLLNSKTLTPIMNPKETKFQFHKQQSLNRVNTTQGSIGISGKKSFLKGIDQLKSSENFRSNPDKKRTQMPPIKLTLSNDALKVREKLSGIKVKPSHFSNSSVKPNSNV